MARRVGRPTEPIARPVLLREARRAFAEAGYAGASMSRIAERIGIRKSTLFHHFGSKQDLYTEAMSGLLVDLASLLGEAMTGPDFASRLDRLGELLGRYLGEHPEAARLLVRELAGHGDVLPDGLGDAVSRVMEATAAFLQAGMDEGAIPVVNAEHLALSLIGLHLLYWAAPGVSGIASGSDIFCPDAVDQRVAEAVAHARRTCGLATRNAILPAPAPATLEPGH
jgi:TetR/AcrR family transcriptional regulator